MNKYEQKKESFLVFESLQVSLDAQNQSSLKINTVEEHNQDQRMLSQRITQPMQVVPQVPQTMPSSQTDLESHRTRKVELLNQLRQNQVQFLKKKQSSKSKNHNKKDSCYLVNLITTVHAKITNYINLTHQTPQQQPFQTHKANSAKQSYRKNLKPIVIDIVKDLKQLNSLGEMNDATLRRVITREEQEILLIQDILSQKISKLQQRLIQLNQIEQRQLDSKMNNNSILNQMQDKENQVEYQQQKGSSQEIRATLIQCLGYKVNHIYYDKKQYQIIFTYQQANVQYSFQNQKQIGINLEMQDIFNEFYRELQKNRLVLSGLKIDYKQKTEINKGEILQLQLKHQFLNSNNIQSR